MLVVNTTVVRALMTLRGLTLKTLSKLAGVREENLRAWLAGSESADLCMARKNQIQVLRALGVDDEAPRENTVHSWVLDESTSHRKHEGLNALHVIVMAYDKADVVHFGPEEDDAFTFTQDSHFGLRFEGFRVVLTVRPAFFRDVQFSPDSVKGLAWSEENPVCLLPAFRFEQIVQVDVTPTEFEDYIAGQVELAKWENLHLLAREHQIHAEDIAMWMFKEVSEREERLSLAYDKKENSILLEGNPSIGGAPQPAALPEPLPATTVSTATPPAPERSPTTAITPGPAVTREVPPLKAVELTLVPVSEPGLVEPVIPRPATVLRQETLFVPKPTNKPELEPTAVLAPLSNPSRVGIGRARKNNQRGIGPSENKMFVKRTPR